MGTLKLPTDKLNYECLKIEVALNYSYSDVKVVTVPTSSDEKLPRLESDEVSLDDSTAIARYVGGENMFGEEGSVHSAEIYEWIFTSDRVLHPNITTWVSPYLGLVMYNKQNENEAMKQVDGVMMKLNKHLLHQTYLTADHVTMADITVAAALYPAYKVVMDGKYRKKYGNVTRWYMTVTNQCQFAKQLPSTEESTYCQTSPKFNKKEFEQMKEKLQAARNSPAVEEKAASGDQKPAAAAAAGKEGAKPKTEAQLKKEEAKKKAKLAKMEKFAAKKKMQEKKQADTKKKPKVEKVKKVVEIAKYTKNTPAGEKKDITDPLPAGYSPQYTEAAWYQWWSKQGFFTPEFGKTKEEVEKSKKFVMCLPPPNVTGSLHLGHALTNTVQDVLARWHRMMGEATLWIPGTDHAGIATQVVVEKKLRKKENLSRHDIGREKFVDKVWEWKEEKGNRICSQLRKLGSSLDWDREFFTMDDKLSFAVKKSFIQLRKEGIIFRSNRLINWSCALKSAISDIEVNKKDLEGRTMLPVPGYDKPVEFGVIHSFHYELCDGSGKVTVATTRIETMLGDTGVAVHPQDKRFTHLHGKFVRHPFCDRQIAIVCDEMVDMEFGTGCVKITPAHDANDYDVGKRHNLEFISIFDENGLVCNTQTQFDGMKRFDARVAVLDQLKKLNLYGECKDNKMVVPLCSRTKDIVEPMVKVQWFLNCDDVAKQSIDAVKTGELEIVPQAFQKTWYHWLDNIRDWCISRQLWWGHRIPAYFVTVNDPSVPAGDRKDEKYWVCGMDAEEAMKEAVEKFNVDRSKITLEQDEDVLDTWYSSGLLPFSIFGWPNETSDLKNYFPGSLLETGHDILFFWIARMVFFSLLLTKKLPFKTVYLHAMVRDAHGRKMSKSLGNVIDPLDVISGITLEDLHKTLYLGNLDPKEIEKAKLGQKQDYPNGIPECGSDALRFALFAYTCQGRDINLDVNRILGYRHFCNKLWNAFKFSTKQLAFGSEYKPQQQFQLSGKETEVDLWILHKLTKSVELSHAALENYQFPDYTTAVYNFWLYEFCDIYLECIKPLFTADNGDNDVTMTSKHVLYHCLDVALRLTQPLMPFICEELWQRLPRRPNDNTPSVCVCKWPYTNNERVWTNDKVDAEMELTMNVVKTTRSLRADYNLTKTKADLYIKCSDDVTAEVLTRHQSTIKTLSYSSQVVITDKPPQGCAVAIVNNKCDVNLMLKGIVNFEKEIEKMETNMKRQEKKLADLKKAVSKSEYKQKVPKEVQVADEEKIKQLGEELAKMAVTKQDFASML